jgi:hypothetical protein
MYKTRQVGKPESRSARKGGKREEEGTGLGLGKKKTIAKLLRWIHGQKGGASGKEQ